MIRTILIVAVLIVIGGIVGFVFTSENTVRVNPSNATEGVPDLTEYAFFQTLPSDRTTTAYPMKFVCYAEPPQDPETLSISVELSNNTTFEVPTDGATPFRVERLFEMPGAYSATCTIVQNGTSYESETIGFDVVRPEDIATR